MAIQHLLLKKMSSNIFTVHKHQGTYSVGNLFLKPEEVMFVNVAKGCLPQK